MKKRKALISTLVLVGLMGLSSCGSNKENGDTSSIEESSSTSHESVTTSSKEDSQVSSQEQISSSISTESETPPVIPEEEIKLHEYFKTEKLPEIKINTTDGLAIDDPSLIDPTQHKGSKGELPVYNYVGATINVDSNGEGYDLTDVASQVKVRGNYTSTYAKRPIRIKFDKKQSLLGLNNNNKFKSWVLLAEWKDTSMLRNTLAGFIANSMMESAGHYASDFRPVKVYLNGEYNGVYNLVEQQQIDSKRVNIPESKLATDGVKTGYFLEYDGYYKNEDAIQTFNVDYLGQNNGNTGFSVTNDIMNQEQHDFVAKCTQNIWKVVYDAIKKTHTDLTTSPFHTIDADGEYVTDTSTSIEEAVSKVIDIESLVDMFILCDISEDRDIGFSSFNLSLDMSETGDRKMTYVAPWDFDYAYGNSTWGNALTLTLANQSAMTSNGRLVKSGTSYKFSDSCVLTKDDFKTSNTSTLYCSTTDNPWLNIFANQGWFWKRVKARWDSAKEARVFSEASNLVDLYTTKYSADYVENATKWSDSFGITLSGYQPSIVKYFVNQRQASEYLKIWYDARIEGLDSTYTKQATKY